MLGEHCAGARRKVAVLGRKPFGPGELPEARRAAPRALDIQPFRGAGRPFRDAVHGAQYRLDLRRRNLCCELAQSASASSASSA